MGCHSCTAIIDSVSDYATGNYYIAQYSKMFGPFEGDIRQEMGRANGYFYVTGFDLDLHNNHPYWDRSVLIAETQQCRVIALLLMADIVEQGCCN